jgi:hypothetical protein
MAPMKFVALILSFSLCGVTAAHSQTSASTSSAPTEASPALPVPSDAAPSGDIWRVMMSPYTLHYSYSPDHKNVYMVGLEHQNADGLVLGGSYFTNSFGQPSAYVYVGWRFDKFTPFEPLFAEVTGGLLYGYKPPYEDKVPFNHNGYSPGAVLSVGWQFTPMFSAQLNFLGNSALMFQFSADFR